MPFGAAMQALVNYMSAAVALHGAFFMLMGFHYSNVLM
jgi:hypothetical protein